VVVSANRISNLGSSERQVLYFLAHDLRTINKVLHMHPFTLIAVFSTLLLVNNCNGPTEPEYISQDEAKEIVITQILKGDTSGIGGAKISEEMVTPYTTVVDLEPIVKTPGYKTWVVQILDGFLQPPMDFKVRWIIINAKSGEYYTVNHWYLRYSCVSSGITFVIFIFGS